MYRFIIRFSCFIICLFPIYSIEATQSSGILVDYDPCAKVFVVKDISHPSGIAFDKAIGDEKHFWVIVDQNGIRNNEHLFEIILSAKSHLVRVEKRITLNNAFDLEDIAINPKDSSFILADERFRNYNGKETDKKAALRRYDICGKELFSQEVREFVHQGNNGLEGIAIQLPSEFLL